MNADQTAVDLSAGDRAEYHKPDIAVAYARLAPLVAEARLHLKHGDIDEADKSLDAAREVMDQLTWMVVVKSRQRSE